MNAVEAKNHFHKFRSHPFRDWQEEAIDFVLTSPKKFTILEAPTGAGKSLMGMCVVKGLGSGIYAVHSKALQLQVEADFPESRVLFGRDNYECLLDPMRTCAQCPATKLKPCALAKKCPYKAQKSATAASELAVLNYAYLFAEINYVGKFSGRRVIVIDEADSLENSLYQFVSLSVSTRMLERYGIDLPGYKTVSTENGLVDWRNWGVETHGEFSAELVKLNRVAENYSGEEDDYDQLIRSIERLEALIRRFEIFNRYLDRSWLLDVKADSRGAEVYHFRPLWLNPDLTRHFLWDHTDRFVLMSATFPPVPVLCKILGIPPGEIDQISLPSTFNPEHRRIIVRPVANLTKETMAEETPKLIKEVKKILAAHPREKGLIHTVSYDLATEIMRIGDPRLITHNSKDKIEVLKRFKQSQDPLVLVSPSSERGISLEADLCRFIILVKAPFLSLGDKAIKQRVYSSQVGQLWYHSDMALTCVQATGRGVRSANDYCISYLLDEQIARCFKTKPILLPGWFREAVEFEYPEDERYSEGLGAKHV